MTSTSEQIEFQVAGVTFEGRQDILWEIKESSSWELLPMKEAKLVREPGNEYDPNAVKVMVGKQQIGYVPKELAAQLSPRLKRKKTFSVDECLLIGLNSPRSRQDILGAKIRLTYTEKGKKK